MHPLIVVTLLVVLIVNYSLNRRLKKQDELLQDCTDEPLLKSNCAENPERCPFQKDSR